MAFLNKEYKFSSSENYDGFLKALGMSEEHIEIMEKFEPTLKLVENDDGTYSNFSTVNGVTEETKFTPGVEFSDEEDGNSYYNSYLTFKNAVKFLYTIEDNVVTQTVTRDGETTTFRREYDGDDLTEEITSDKFDGVAKRYYKA